MPTAVLERARCQQCSTHPASGVLLDTAEGEQLCQDCCMELDLCFGCDQPSRDTHECADRAYRCADCRDGWARCDDCHRYTEYITAITGGGDVCDDCALTYHVCSDCDTRTDDYHLVDGERHVCDACRQLEYHYCFADSCDTLIPINDSYCEYCDPHRDGLHDADYSPRPAFHGHGPLYLGLELELNTAHFAFDDAVVMAKTELGELAYLKNDHSIGCGFEIVTHPMSYDYAIEQFPWGVLPRLRLLGASTDSEVGIHIHLSRKGFDSPSHIYRWLRLIYRNHDHVIALARRDSTWAKWDAGHRDHRRAAHGLRTGARYQAVNTCPYDTFELRVFASSLYRRQVQAALAFAHATVEYTRHLTVADVVHRRGWEWSRFIAWVADRPEYAPLIDELTDLRDTGALDHLDTATDFQGELACAS